MIWFGVRFHERTIICMFNAKKGRIHTVHHEEEAANYSDRLGVETVVVRANK